jgi:hypothetical protein
MKCKNCPLNKSKCLGEDIKRICEKMEESPEEWKGVIIESSVVRFGGDSKVTKLLNTNKIAVESCPDRGDKVSCGCGGLNECKRGKGSMVVGEDPNKRYVSYSECFDCLNLKKVSEI